MEIYDIIMVVVLVGAMLFGAVKGFAWQLASIASIILSYIVAYKYREPFSQSIQADPPWNRFLAMLILYIGTSLVIWVAFRMIRGTIDRMKLREFDRQIGAMFGLAKGALYCTLITLFAVTLMGDRTRETIVRSKSGHYIAQVLDRSESVIPPEIHEVVQPYLERFDRRFNRSGDGMIDRAPWLAGDSPQTLSDGLSDGLSRLPQTLPDSLTGALDGAVPRVPDPGFQAAPSTNGPLPIDPRQWSLPQTARPAPQQAQQPIWNGFQR